LAGLRDELVALESWIEPRVAARVAGIADTLAEVLRTARRSATTPDNAARQRARQLIASAAPNPYPPLIADTSIPEGPARKVAG